MLVVITPQALKQYKHLPVKVQVRIKKKLSILESNPLEGKKLSSAYSDVRSLRAWPYRILYSIDAKHKKVFVVTIAHRQGVYT